MTPEATAAMARQQEVPQGRPLWDGRVWAESFRKASESQAWTLGFRSVDVDVLQTPRLRIEGLVPSSLRGTLFRNGPARHERGGMRYGHRYDGDGMVQAFTFTDEGISHRGRFVQTRKYLEESAAARFVHSAFGTAVPGAEALPSELDQVNVANINALLFAGELLALWEPGSAYRLDPRTLETRGVKTWRPDLVGLPFSGHPKVEPDGTLWNFGANPVDSILYLYHVSKDGELLRAHSLSLDYVPPVHDFAVTERHLVFLMPPLLLNREDLEDGASFAEACEWRPKLGMRVLTVAKEDWSQRWYELPSGSLFHVGNAWEDEGGVIRLDYMRADDPRILIAGWSVMRGEYKHAKGAEMNLLTLNPSDGSARQAVLEGEGEFPRVDPRVVGHRYEHVVTLGRSRDRDRFAPGYDEVRRVNVESGNVDVFSYGPDWLLDEHILVPNLAKGEGGWIVGTALDLRQGVTVVSVFDAESLEAGPVAQAALDYPLPSGLHGNFATL